MKVRALWMIVSLNMKGVCVYVFMHIGVSVAAYMCVHAYMCMSLLLYIAALTGWI